MAFGGTTLAWPTCLSHGAYRRGRLARVLVDWCPHPMGNHLYYSSRRRLDGWVCCISDRRLRLVKAQRLLTDPPWAGRLIASIAFESGFRDLFYFNRRGAYGAMPSDIRSNKVDRSGT